MVESGSPVRREDSRSWNSRKPSYEHIAPVFPKHRGKVRPGHLSVLNAILYGAEQGCTWRGLPTHFGHGHTISTRMNRWAKKVVLDQVFAELQRLDIIRVKVEVLSLDSTVVKVHPDGTGALGKHGAQAIATSRGGGGGDYQASSGRCGGSKCRGVLPVRRPEGDGP